MYPESFDPDDPALLDRTTIRVTKVPIIKHYSTHITQWIVPTLLDTMRCGYPIVPTLLDTMRCGYPWSHISQWYTIHNYDVMRIQYNVLDPIMPHAWYLDTMPHVDTIVHNGYTIDIMWMLYIMGTMDTIL